MALHNGTNEVLVQADTNMSIQADTVLASGCTLLVLGETRALRRTFGI